MALALQLAKDGQAPNKLVLGLAKSALFDVELFWSDIPGMKIDIDSMALLATNNGNGAKVTAFEQVLSIHNVKKAVTPNGVLVFNRDGKSFNTPESALRHSGDARTGDDADIDEVITIDGSKVPAGVNEIPIFINIYSPAVNFDKVKSAGVRIKHDGKTLQEYILSNQFGGFNSVQMGSLILEDNAWKFVEVATGFNGDTNTILGHFS